MRATRRTVALLLVALAALAGVALVAQWSALQWAADQAVRASGGRLRVERVSGGVVGGVRIGALQWRDGSTQATLAGVLIRWNPWALLRREVDLTAIEAASVELRAASTGGETSLPESLRLPFDVRVGALRVASLKIGGVSGDPLGLRDVELAGTYAQGRYRIDSLSLAGDWGSVRAQATLADEAPYALSANARATLAWRSLAVDASADGPLAALALHASASADGSGRLSIAGTVRPLAAQPVTRLDLRGEDLDAQWLGLGEAWRARITGSAVARPLAAARGEAAGWIFDIDVANALPGPLDARAIPLSTLAGALEWRAGRLHAPRAVAGVPGGGDVRGEIAIDTSARIELPGATLIGLRTDLRVSGLDAARLVAKLPSTRLGGTLRWADGGFDADVADTGRSGISLAARGAVHAKAVEIERARVNTGAGAFSLSGRIGVGAPWPADLALEFDRFEPSAVPALLQRLDAVPAIGARAAALAEATRGWRELSGAVSGRGRVEGPLRLGAGTRPTALSLRVDGGSLAGLAARASVDAKLTAVRASDVRVDVSLDRSTLHAEGALGAAGDRLEVNARIASLAPLAGLAGLPGLAGSLQADATLRGTLRAPAVSAQVTASGLALPHGVAVRRLDATAEVPSVGEGASTARVAVHARARGVRLGERPLDEVRVEAAGTAGSHEFALEAEGGALRVRVAGTGALAGDAHWRATLKEAVVRERVEVALRGPVAVEADAAGFRSGPAVFASEFGELRLARLAWRDGRYEVGADLRLARLVSLAERFGSTQATEARQAGVADDSSLELAVALAGTGVADPSGTLSLRVRGAGVVPDGVADLAVAEGRLSGRLAFEIPSIAAVNRMIGPQWAVAGRLRFDGSAAGTVVAPRLDGAVVGEALRLEQRALGWRLGDGTLAARFDGETLRVASFRLRNVGAAAKAAAPDAGSIELAGEVGVANRQGTFTLTASRLSVPIGPGQRVVLTGNAQIASRAGEFDVRGGMRLDEGLIEIGSGDVPTPPDDVVVRGREGPSDAATVPQERLRIGADLSVDLGDKLRVRGRGLDARLGGTLALRGRLPDAPRAFGTIRVRDGRYTAYGRQLDIRRGAIVFNGPLDNPQLEIVALRGGLPVEAGVEVTGHVLAPRVRLTSVPDVPDSEKLSWLVLGAPLEDAHTQAQGAALQAAASTLLGRNDGTLSGGIAGALGLDVLTLRSTATAQSGLVTPELGSRGFGTSMPAIPGQVGGGPQTSPQGTTGQNVVAIGKRLNSRLLVSYEQGLRGVWNLLMIQYEISQRLSVRATTGSESAIDVLYRFRFD